MNEQLSENLDPKADSEELAATALELDFSHKKRIIEGRGKEVPMDLFLYSCLEEERLIRASPISEEFRWSKLPAVAGKQSTQKTTNPSGGALETADSTVDSNRDNSDAQADKIAQQKATQEKATQEKIAEEKIAHLKNIPLTESIQNLVMWFRTHHPALASTQPLDHTQLNEVRHPLVAMVRDIEDLYLISNQSGVPNYNPEESYWNAVLQATGASFPTYAHMIKRYLEWSYGEETKEEFVRGSRPPVGRFAPPPLPRNKSGGSFDRSAPGKPPRRDTRDNDRKTNPSKAPRSGGTSNRQGKSQSDQGNKDRGRPSTSSSNRSKPRGSGRRSTQGQDEQTAKQEKMAMDAVKQGIETLSSHPELSEVVLEATNSFYRRLQHQKVEELGYSSGSLGEGSSRSVVIKKDS